MEYMASLNIVSIPFNTHVLFYLKKSIIGLLHRSSMTCNVRTYIHGPIDQSPWSVHQELHMQYDYVQLNKHEI
jgi:hypothetical protein